MSGNGEQSKLPFGPVQMLVLGFDRIQFDGQIMPELDRLRDAGIIRLIDLLFVRKQEDGELETIQRSDLSKDEAEDFGAIIGALIGAGAGEDLESSMVGGAAELSDGHLLEEEDVWYITDALPDGTSAAIALIEHRWAIPLREKLLAADGVVLADEWVHPADLIAVGAAAKAKAAADAEA
jgi:uncharacterized membrane protein